MNDYQIKNFLTIVRKGSISAAAQTLYISAQALHQRVKTMEDEVGFKLFTRTRKGVALTEAGKIFYEGAVKIDQTYANALSAAKKAADTEQNTITIWSNGSFSDLLYHEAVHAFWREHPNVKLVFLAPRARCCQEIDIILNDITDTNGFEQEELFYRTCLYAVFRPGHPFLRNQEITWDALFSSHVIVPEPDLLARVLPEFWEELANHGMSEEDDGHFPLQSDSVVLSYGCPVDSLLGQSSRPISNSAFNVCFLTKKPIRPMVKTYIAFMRDYYKDRM